MNTYNTKYSTRCNKRGRQQENGHTNNVAIDNYISWTVIDHIQGLGHLRMT